ncbi:MAG: DUF3710 domain-containing protein [Nocardioides sp.]|uniref:DUF3710 domain-containing protein n=1 Tax=Nocardioides sp. TaxID=35761 RepID=UPI0039E2EF10
MRFRRNTKAVVPDTAPETTDEPADTPVGPYDVDAIPPELADVERVDLGSILVAPVPGCDLRLQIDERTQDVQAVLLTAEEGALELRAFAAPRNGDLWADVRPQLAADIVRRGGQVGEAEGTWGTHLLGQMPVKLPDGSDGVQASRIIGINGSRWMLRATLLGRPAVDGEFANAWLQGIAASAVRRGAHALPVGEALPLVMPAQAR